MAQPAAARSAGSSRSSHEPLTLLVVDDDLLHARLLRANLERPGSLRVEFIYKEKVVAATDASLAFETSAPTATGVRLTGKTFDATVSVIGQNGVFSVAVSAKAARESLRQALFSL